MDKIPKYKMLKQVQHDMLYNASHCKSKKCAFTLAEVLITLVIIGVIAALTIPNLMQKYQEQVTVKKVQKFYSNLSNAFNLAEKENGSISDWKLTGYGQDSAEKIYELLFKPYFKIAKNCGVTNTGNCIKNERYKALNNEIASGSGYAGSTKHYKFNLDDGSTVIFYQYNEFVIFIYDVNGGINAPNQLGKDTFGFYSSTTINRLVPFGLQSKPYNHYPFYLYCKTTDTSTYAGAGCAAWVIYKGNMDYLHCDGLTWNSRSCKDK